MTDKEIAFFRECLKNPLMNPELLHIALPQYSVQDYKRLQELSNSKKDVDDIFKWNAIRCVLQFSMRELDFQFTELMACIAINRYLMFEYLNNKKYKDDWIKKKRKVSKRIFEQLLAYDKKMARKARKRTK